MEIEAGTPSAIETPITAEAAQTPEASQEAIYAEFKAAGNEGRAYQPQKKTSGESPEYKSKLEERINKEEAGPKTVKFAAPNSQMQIVEKIAKESQDKIKELSEFLKNAELNQANQAELFKKEIELENYKIQAAQNLEAWKGMIKQEFTNAFNDDTFKEQHDFYSPVFAEIEGGDELSNAILTDPNRLRILAEMYKWLDMPGNAHKFRSITPEQRLQSVKILSMSLKYPDRIPAAAPQIARDRIPATQAPNPANPMAAIAPPKDPGPGNGAGGNSYDPKDQEAIYRRHFPKQQK